MTQADIKTGPAPALTKLESVRMTVDSHTENLPAVGNFIRTFALGAGLSERESAQIELAVDELVTNSITHGYSGSKEGTILIEASTIPGGIMVVLEEKGGPFDPDSVEDPDLDAPLAERKIGGLGLFFVRQVMDEIYYEAEESGGKRFTLIRRKRGE